MTVSNSELYWQDFGEDGRVSDAGKGAIRRWMALYAIADVLDELWRHG